MKKNISENEITKLVNKRINEELLIPMDILLKQYKSWLCLPFMKEIKNTGMSQLEFENLKEEILKNTNNKNRVKCEWAGDDIIILEFQKVKHVNNKKRRRRNMKLV